MYSFWGDLTVILAKNASLAATSAHDCSAGHGLHNNVHIAGHGLYSDVHIAGHGLHKKYSRTVLRNKCTHCRT